MRELWINNQSVDLYPDEKIALTKQCNKLNELKDRQADYSNQFRIPPTTNNLRICGFPHVVGSDSINPYTKLPSTYIENGSELISNGVGIIEGFEGGISVTLYSGIFDFFNTLGERSIRELDLSELNHVFNLANVIAGNGANYNYNYPLIQWGAVRTDDDIVDIRYQMPCVKVLLIMDKIFEAAGYQKAGAFFNFNSYLNLIMPVVEDSLIDTDATLLAESFKAHTDSVITKQGNHLHFLSFRDIDSGDAFNSTAGWYNQGRYTAGTKVTVNIRVRLFYSNTVADNNPNPGFRLYIVKNNDVAYPINPLATTTSYKGVGVIDILMEDINLSPGEYLQLHGGFSTGIFSIYPTGALQGDPLQYSYWSVTAVNTIELGQNLSLNNLVPDIKQKDLIKDLMIIYGLIPQVDNLTRTINFTQFDNLGDSVRLGHVNADPLTTVDWSDKLHLGIEPKIRYRFDGYAQQNIMKWAQDDSRGEAGNGTIFIDDNTLPEKVDLFTTVFASSIQEPNFKGSNTGVNIKRYTRIEADTYSNTQDYVEGDRALVNGTVYETSEDVTGVTPPTAPWFAVPIQFEKTDSAAPRLLVMRDYVGTLNYTDGSNVTAVSNIKLAYFVDSTQPFDLSFQFIISERYQTIQRILNKTKIVDAYFKLSDNDFKNIDFFKPIYITYFGNYFYLNQGTNYISGRLTSCELVRL